MPKALQDARRPIVLSEKCVILAHSRGIKVVNRKIPAAMAVEGWKRVRDYSRRNSCLCRVPKFRSRLFITWKLSPTILFSPKNHLAVDKRTSLEIHDSWKSLLVGANSWVSFPLCTSNYSQVLDHHGRLCGNSSYRLDLKPNLKISVK